MSVHTSSIHASTSALGPGVPTAVHPRGISRSTGQIEYCSSWLMTAVYVVLSSRSSLIGVLRKGKGSRAVS
jgi:hypothetical protein